MPGTASRFIPPKSSSVPHDDCYPPAGASADRTVRIDWRLINDNGAYKINDVIVEGIGMAVTQRRCNSGATQCKVPRQ